MRIGIDCRTILNPELGEYAGVGHYTYYLVKNLLKLDKKNEYVLYFDWRVWDTKEFEQKNVKIKHFPFSQYKKFLPFAYSHLLITAYLVKDGLTIFHSPANVLPLTYPKKCVITIHDLAIYKDPSWFPSQIFSTKLLVPQSIRKADRIIAVSESTKKDLKQIFNVPAKKIAVTYEGVIVDKFPVKKKLDVMKKFKLPDHYILFVGTLERRKNLINLVRAYKKLITWDKKLERCPLILAGHESWKSEEIHDEVRELKLANLVRFLGYISHNEKIDLMKKACCFVNPSLYEGFGLTMVEAMALGTPVIASDISSMPEVVGKAAILVDPEKEYEIAAALKKLLNSKDLQNKLIKKGIEQAKNFSWTKCSHETLKVYESLKK